MLLQCYFVLPMKNKVQRGFYDLLESQNTEKKTKPNPGFKLPGVMSLGASFDEQK